jgi:hypothetical protein
MDGAYLGTFLAPEANVMLEQDATLAGALYGEQVHVKKSAVVTGEPALALIAHVSTGGMVPTGMFDLWVGSPDNREHIVFLPLILR